MRWGPVRARILSLPISFTAAFFAASEKQGGIRPCSLWYELCLLVLLMALLRIC